MDTIRSLIAAANVKPFHKLGYDLTLVDRNVWELLFKPKENIRRYSEALDRVGKIAGMISTDS